MINYENAENLTHLSRKEKLQIVRKEIDKIIDINDLLFNALQHNKYKEDSSSYLYASFLIASYAVNIRKMFP